jgi:hypothetical protein
MPVANSLVGCAEEANGAVDVEERAMRNRWLVVGLVAGSCWLTGSDAFAQDVLPKPTPGKKAPTAKAPAEAPAPEEAEAGEPTATGDEQAAPEPEEAAPEAEDDEIPQEPLVHEPEEEPQGPPPPPYEPPPPPGYWGPPPGYGGPPPGYGGYGWYPPMPPEEIEDEGQPPPPGYIRKTRVRKGLVIAGAVTFGSTWLVSAVLAGIAMDDGGDDGDAFAPLFAPVVGPFIAISTLEAESLGTAILVLDGIAQAGGLAMLIAGIAAQESVYVRVGPMGKVRIDPLVGKEGGGAAFSGQF